MYRFFQEKYPDAPRFWFAFKITEEFIGAAQNINSIKNLLTGDEALAAMRAENTFLGNLIPYLNEQTDNTAPFYEAIYVLKYILNAYHLRQVSKPEYKEFVI